jgi:hypothetical protein
MNEISKSIIAAFSSFLGKYLQPEGGIFLLLFVSFEKA